MSTPHQDEFFSWDHDASFLYAGGNPVCFHCHHYNLFIQSTVDDALGAPASAKLRQEASADAWRPILRDFLARHEAPGIGARLELASALYASAGHGRLDLSQLSPAGGIASARHLHHSDGWKFAREAERSRHPMGAVAAGYLATAFELAYDLEPGTARVTQTACTAQGDDTNIFTLAPGEQARALHPTLTRAQMQAHAGARLDALHDAEIDRISREFRAMLAGISGDERGLVEGFGILVTLTPTSYYNILCTRMLDTLQREHPRLLDVSEQMLYEAGRLCGFNTFGGVLRSPEWESIVGERTGEAMQTLAHTCAIARSFGFGRWSISEYYPEDLVIFCAPMTYEDPHAMEYGESAERPACYLFTGASEAMTRLAEEVTWEHPPRFGLDTYEHLVKRSQQGWRATQTRSRVRGDARDEVHVEP